MTYENEVYREARRHLPKVGSRVRCPAGTGTVRKLDLLAKMVSLTVPGADGLQTFPADRLEWGEDHELPPPRSGERGCGNGGCGKARH
jgi:hypothetical protein